MRFVVTTALAVLVAALGACTSTSGPASDTAPVGSNRPSVTAPAAPSAAPSSKPPAPAAPPTSAKPTPSPVAKPGVARFGQTYTWADGLAVTVSAPADYKPSKSAAGAKAGVPYLVFTITIVNGTDTPFDPVLFHATAQSGNEEAEPIFDSANKVGGSPSTKVLPGREVTFKIAFSTPTPTDVVLEVSPSFEHDSVMYAS